MAWTRLMASAFKAWVGFHFSWGKYSGMWTLWADGTEWSTAVGELGRNVLCSSSWEENSLLVAIGKAFQIKCICCVMVMNHLLSPNRIAFLESLIVLQLNPDACCCWDEGYALCSLLMKLLLFLIVIFFMNADFFIRSSRMITEDL